MAHSSRSQPGNTQYIHGTVGGFLAWHQFDTFLLLLMLMAFLQRVVNCGGEIIRELAVWNDPG